MSIKNLIQTCYTTTIYQLHVYLFYESSFIHVFARIIELKLLLSQKQVYLK